MYFGVYDTSVGNATVYAVLPSGTLRWKYSVLGAGDLSSSPLVFCKGNIFLAGGLNTQLYIFSPDGRVLWTYSLFGYTNPAVVAFQDVVYVNSNDVFAFNVTSQALLWSTSVGGFSTVPAIGRDGTVYLNSNYGDVYAVTASGLLKWVHSTSSGYSSNSLATGPGGMVYLGGGDGHLYAIQDVDGVPTAAPATMMSRFPTASPASRVAPVPDEILRWKYLTSAFTYTSSTPVTDSQGTVYYAVGNSVYALYPYSELYPTATLKWEFNTGGDYLEGCWPAVGSDGTVYVPGYYLYAVSSVGSLNWKYLTGSGSQGRPLVGVNGTVYSMCMAYLYTYLCSLSQDGKLNWMFKLDGTINAQSPDGTLNALFPIEGPDGTVYFGAFDTSVGNATVYAVPVSYTHLTLPTKRIV